MKNPHACHSGAAEAVAPGAGAAAVVAWVGAEAVAAGIGAEASSSPPPPPQAQPPPPLPSARETSKTDVEWVKSQAKSSSPLKERLTTFFTHGMSAKAKEVTQRLYISPNKNHSKSEEGDESHSKASPQKIKHLRTRRRRTRTRNLMKKKMKCAGQKNMKVQMMTMKLLSNQDNCNQTAHRNVHENV